MPANNKFRVEVMNDCDRATNSAQFSNRLGKIWREWPGRDENSWAHPLISSSSSILCQPARLSLNIKGCFRLRHPFTEEVAVWVAYLPSSQFYICLSPLWYLSHQGWGGLVPWYDMNRKSNQKLITMCLNVCSAFWQAYTGRLISKLLLSPL